MNRRRADVRPRSRRVALRTWFVFVVLGGVLIGGVVVGLRSHTWLPADPLQTLRDRYAATLVVDRDGEPLRLLSGPLASRGRPVPLAELGARVRTATLVAEDQRYWSHVGIDPVAVARAMWRNVRAGRVTSGASTLTQQLVRMMRPRRRTLRNKLEEALGALELERRYDKATLLAWYLNHAPYGGLTRGVEQAARGWLAKPAVDLSWAEAAWLAVLPRSPTALNPAQHPRAALVHQRRLLRRLHRLGHLDDDTLAVALSQPIVVRRGRSPFDAPHAADWLQRAHPDRPLRFETTLDVALQRQVQDLTRQHVARAAHLGVRNAAVVVLDVKDAEIRVMVGSHAWQDSNSAGTVNGALALRQPGSTLKPFIYALAFADGRAPGDTLLDIERHFSTPHGDWQPENYGRQFHGPVSARVALASSLNVPAVSLLAEVGVDRLQATLGRLGASGLTRRPQHYGLGLALGSGELSLLELAGAYGALARGGRWKPPHLLRRMVSPTGAVHVPIVTHPVAVLDPQAAWLVGDSLRDARARRLSFPRGGPLDGPWGAACKTGTSKGYRDNWTVCFTSAHVVAVWAGDFSGRPMRDGASGLTGAAPLAHDVLAALYGAARPPPFARPPGLVQRRLCALSGAPANHACPHRTLAWSQWPATPPCDWHHHDAGGQLRVTLPAALGPWRRATAGEREVAVAPAQQDRPQQAAPQLLRPHRGARYWLDSATRRSAQAVPVVVADHRSARYHLEIDGVQQPTVLRGGEPFAWQASPGRHELVARRIADGAQLRTWFIVEAALPGG